MPIYEYYCDNCDNVNEYLVFPWSKEEQLHCKKCDQTNIRKLISVFSIKASPIDNLNWLPSKETLSDVDQSDQSSVSKHMNRIKQARQGNVSNEFKNQQNQIKNFKKP